MLKDLEKSPNFRNRKTEQQKTLWVEMFWLN
jgi:hypothetical protein